MTKLNRKVEYSLMALKFLTSRDQDKVTAKEVSDSLQAPFDVMARVMQVMAQKGLLVSEQGASGGYRLGRKIEDITLFELVQIIEGPTSLVKCLDDESGCEIQSSCNISSPVRALNEKLNQFFKNISVQELVKREHHV